MTRSREPTRERTPRAAAAARASTLALAVTLAAASCVTADGRVDVVEDAADVAAAPTDYALQLLFTSDEHGWLLPLKDKGAGVLRGGVIALYDRLVRVEGYAPTPAARDAGWLLLSSGDMWTGPYESTVLEGAPMVAAMSHMGYAAAAIGNHEFDFGVRVLGERGRTARFPLLAANLVEQGSGKPPPWARPFTIVEAGGVKVGVIGFTNVDTPITCDPRHLVGLKFLPYAESLAAAAQQARAAGAQELVALVHEELAVGKALVPLLRQHGVRAAAFGHHHQPGEHIDDNGTPDTADDIVLCNAGPYMRSYCRIDLKVTAGRLAERSVRVTQVETPIGEAPPLQDPELLAVVHGAEESANRIGGEVLVQSAQALKRGVDGALGQLVVDSWLAALPYVQVAITNAGGLRQDLPAGPLRTRDIVSVLPFNNYLLVVDLTGAQLREVLQNPESIAGGVRYRVREIGDDIEVVDLTYVDGRPVKDGDRLKVVVNDFMYRGGDRYELARHDGEPEETAVDWREPVLRRLREMGTRNEALSGATDDRLRWAD